MEPLARADALDSYRIPKEEVAIEIAFGNHGPDEASVFLSPFAGLHPGPERPSDLLLNDDPFLTIRSSDGAIRFVHKRAIAWMAVAPELEDSGRCPSEATLAASRCHPIDIELDDGRLFSGKVSVWLPDASSRLKDFLNAAGPFFEVRNERAVCFVNRDRVVMVKPTE